MNTTNEKLVAFLLASCVALISACGGGGGGGGGQETGKLSIVSVDLSEAPAAAAVKEAP